MLCSVEPRSSCRTLLHVDPSTCTCGALCDLHAPPAPHPAHMLPMQTTCKKYAPLLAHARPCLNMGWALNRRFEEIMGPWPCLHEGGGGTTGKVIALPGCGLVVVWPTERGV